MYPLWTRAKYPFGSLDESLITVQEIVTSAIISVKRRTKKGEKPNTQGLSVFQPSKEYSPFNIALLRKPPTMADLSTLVELRLDNCGITLMDLTRVPMLQRLSLSNNLTESAHLAHSGIERLSKLFALDIRHNRLKDKKSLKRVLVSIPALQQVWIIPNPCYPEDTPKYRKKLAMLRTDTHFKLIDGFDTSAHYV